MGVVPSDVPLASNTSATWEEALVVVKGQFEVAVHDVEYGTKCARRVLGNATSAWPGGVSCRLRPCPQRRDLPRGHRYSEGMAAALPAYLEGVRRHRWERSLLGG